MIDKKKQKEVLIQLMQQAEELGLYDLKIKRNDDTKSYSNKR
jgi:hypothetical protein